MPMLIMNSKPGTGRGAFVEMVQDLVKYPLFNISPVNLVKEVAVILGWNGIKDGNMCQFGSGSCPRRPQPIIPTGWWNTPVMMCLSKTPVP